MKKRVKMKEVKKILQIIIIFSLTILLISFAKSQFPQTPQLPEPIMPPSQSLWQPQPMHFYPYYMEDPAMQYGFEAEMCNKTGMDFIVQIMPDACTPAPVRSDLLEEQNVPVFCRLTGIKINPLIQVPYIERIDATTQERSPEIASVTFHPPRSALSFMSYLPPTEKNQLEGVPTMNNLGYLVIFLKQQPSEEKMPDSVKVEETLKLTYNIARTFGIYQNSFVLEETTMEEWQDKYKKYSFWNGKGYLRLEEIQGDKAKIAVYKNSRQRINSVLLGPGQKSKEIKLPGFYCGAGVEIQVDEITTPKTRARLLINGEEDLVGENENILDTECEISRIYASSVSFTGSIEIRCRTKTYYLELKNLGAKLKIGGATEDYYIGDELSDDTLDGIHYLGYVGKEYSEKDKDITSYIIIFRKTDGKELKVSEKNKIITAINEIVKERQETGKNIISVPKEIIIEKLKNDYKISSVGSNLWIITSGRREKGIYLVSSSGLIEATYSHEVEEAFQEAVQSYENIDYSYPLVPNIDGTVYGIQALDAAAKLSSRFNKKETEAKYLAKIIDKYSESEANVSDYVDEARKNLAELLSADPSRSTKILSTEQGEYRVTLLSIEKPGLQTQSVTINVNGEEKIYSLYDSIEDEWRIEEIKENSILIRCAAINCGTEQNRIEYGTSQYLSIGLNFYARDKTITLKNIKLIKEVKVTILPFERKRETIANFTIEIGIEKRAIKLNPEKTNERIQQLDQLISKLEGFRDNLGKVVSTWKKACLVGASALWAKNFLTGLSGESLARRKTMDYWSDWCSKKQNQEKVGASTVSGCYKAKKEEIKGDVEKTKSAIQKANEFVKEVKSKPEVVKKSGLFGLGSTVDEEKFFEEANNLIKTDKYEELREQIIGNVDIKNIDLTKLRESGLGTEDVKDIIYNLQLQKSCENNELTKEVICNKVEIKNIDTFTDYEQLVENARRKLALSESQDLGLKKLALSPSSFIPIGKDTRLLNRPVEKVLTPTGEKEAIMASTTKGEVIIVVKETGTSGIYAIEKEAYLVNKEGSLEANNIWENIKEEASGITIRKIDPKKCSGNKISEDDKIIRFWESGPYKSMVASMPINPEQGFYVATKGYSGFEGGLTAYKKITGDINTYIIGNVGPNNRIEFDFSTGQPEQDGDDCASTIALVQGIQQVYVEGVDQITANNLNKKAKKCIQQAIQAYNRGDRRIRTDCGIYNIGKPPSVRPTAQCEDFMSPDDCWIMYNLCDPVICPASRCDLGGRYPVDNVMSTGIIGSLMLCWPNFENGKGTLVPICLTGLHAGIDNLAVTLKMARDCLEENVKTGKMTGICDQILSIYMCDFLWQNLDPLIKAGIPSLTESLTSKGGGEYALFSESWKNSFDSISYFTDYYGINTFQAFKERSTKQVGVEVCKRFMSVAYPTQAKFWEEISKPESPTSFFATLEELEGIAGSQSHYKVYYQIYAGQDQGVAYRVYLKSPPSPGYYYIPERYFVPNAYGYLAAGQYKSETPDFIAPQGYNEICVDINGQEHCGFGQITTLFALDELQNLYLKEQLDKPITKTKDCISGAPSFIPAPSLNLQSALKTTIEPAIYKRGIIRICASGNPGFGTDSNRYKLVGYCDNPNIGCYLDMHSVDDSISDLGIRADIAQAAESKNINKLVDEQGLATPQESINKLLDKEKELNIIKEDVDSITNQIYDSIMEQAEQGKEIDEIKLSTLLMNKDDKIKEINLLIYDFEEISSKCIYDTEKARAEFNIAQLTEFIARLKAIEEITKTDLERERENTCESIKNKGTWRDECLVTEEEITGQMSDKDDPQNQGKKCCREKSYIPGEELGILPFKEWPVEKYFIVGGTGGGNYLKDCLKEDDKYIEIITEENDIVKAVAPGTVIKREIGTDGTTYIIIKHSSNLYTYYGHLEYSPLNVGNEILKAGQEIGRVKNIVINWHTGGGIPGVQLKSSFNIGKAFKFLGESVGKFVTFKKYGLFYFRVFTSQDFSKEKSKDPMCFFSEEIIKKFDIETSACYFTPTEMMQERYYKSSACQKERREISTVSRNMQEALDPYLIKIKEESLKQEIDWKLLAALIYQESRANPNAISWTGCAGIAQFCYGTAQSFSSIFEDLTPCCPPGSSCPMEAQCNAGNDDRFDPDKSIEAAAIHLSNLITNFNQYTDKEKFALASYNGGDITINKAIERTGISNPSWEEASTQINEQLIFEVYCEGKQEKCSRYFDEVSERKEKAKQITNYVTYVFGYKNSLIDISELEDVSTIECKEITKEEYGDDAEQLCLSQIGNCWWDHSEKDKCVNCPQNKKCEGDRYNIFSGSWWTNTEWPIFKTKEDCEENNCFLELCIWTGEECKTGTTSFKITSLINNFLRQDLEITVYGPYKTIGYYLNYPNEFKPEEFEESRLPIIESELEELKSELESIRNKAVAWKLSDQISDINDYLDKINILLDKLTETTQTPTIPVTSNIILVSRNKNGIYDNNDKIISYHDSSKVCVILYQNQNYYNDDEDIETISLNGQPQPISVQNLNKNILIKWYEIIPYKNHGLAGFSNYNFPDIIDPNAPLEDPVENYMWYQNVVGTKFWSQGKDTIQYYEKLVGEDWCMYVDASAGTHFYRAEIKIVGEEEFYSPGRALFTLGKKASDVGYGSNNIFDGKESTLLEESAYSFNIGGINNVHRISRRSKYGFEHQEYLKTDYPGYGSTINELLFIEYIEAHYNIPWLWDAHPDQVKNFIGFECIDLALNPIREMAKDNLITLSTNFPGNIPVDDFANIEERKINNYEEKYFYNPQEGKIYDSNTNELKSLFIGHNDLHIGDLFLLSKTNEEKCRHVIILYEDKGAIREIDEQDIFINVDHSGAVKETLSQILTEGKNHYFQISRMIELNQ